MPAAAGQLAPAHVQETLASEPDGLVATNVAPLVSLPPVLVTVAVYVTAPPEVAVLGAETDVCRSAGSATVELRISW